MVARSDTAARMVHLGRIPAGPFMSASKRMGRSKRRQKKSLLSHSSVLIFSAFLIGAVAHRVIPAGMHIYVLAVGAVGLLSYLGLDIAAEKRREQRKEIADQQAVNRLEGRLNRHITPRPRIRTQRSRSADWKQFVPFSKSNRA